jgi:hypothetical protein
MECRQSEAARIIDLEAGFQPVVRATEIVDLEGAADPSLRASKSFFFNILQNNINYKSARRRRIRLAATVAARASGDAR